MPLQTSGRIRFSDIAAEFNITGAFSLSQLYRGGGIVPTSKTVTVINRQPTSGSFYSDYGRGDNQIVFPPSNDRDYYFKYSPSANVNAPNTSGVFWGYFYNSTTETFQGINYQSLPGQLSQYFHSPSGFTYYRSSFVRRIIDYKGTAEGAPYYYRIYRTSSSQQSVSINTSVPSSGLISLSNFYGADGG